MKTKDNVEWYYIRIIPTETPFKAYPAAIYRVDSWKSNNKNKGLFYYYQYAPFGLVIEYKHMWIFYPAYIIELLKNKYKKKNNSMKNVTITVTGLSATGKSTIISLIKNNLKEHGFDVNVEPTFDYKNETEFDEQTLPNLDKKISKIKDITKINLREVHEVANLNKYNN